MFLDLKHIENISIDKKIINEHSLKWTTVINEQILLSQNQKALVKFLHLTLKLLNSSPIGVR